MSFERCPARHCGRALLLVMLLVALAAVPPAALAAPGDISTVAGGAAGEVPNGGDGGPAVGAQLDEPLAVAPAPGGGFLIADPGESRIRRVSAAGTITTAAGTGITGFSGDGGPATAARLNEAWGVAATSDGGFLIADAYNHAVRKVSSDGRIETVAGTLDHAGFTGDGGPATEAKLYFPTAVAPTADGGFLISDMYNERIRKVFANGTIETVAGSTATPGFGGDGGPAIAAALAYPNGIAVTADGGFLIADTANQRVRRVRADGTIVSVAGAGAAGLSGDGGLATSALLNSPQGVAATADGGFLIADSLNHRIRRVTRAGAITTVAGTSKGFSGDGGPAVAARLNDPYGVAVTPRGGLLIADTSNLRIRAVSGPAAGRPGAMAPAVPGRGPAFGARTKVFLSLTHRRIGARARLGVTVRNANSFALSGSLSGHSRDRFRSGGRKHVRRPIRLAPKRFAVAARGRTRLSLRLSPRLRSRLAHAGRLAVVLTARVTDPAGHSRRVTRTLTVRLAHAPRKRR